MKKATLCCIGYNENHRNNHSKSNIYNILLLYVIDT